MIRMINLLLTPSLKGKPFLLVDPIKSRFFWNTEKRCFISSLFWYFFPYLFITKRTNQFVYHRDVLKVNGECTSGKKWRTYLLVKRAKEITLLDWPKILTNKSSTFCRASEIKVDSWDPMRSTRTTNARTALTDMFLLYARSCLIFLLQCLS